MICFLLWKWGMNLWSSKIEVCCGAVVKKSVELEKSSWKKASCILDLSLKIFKAISWPYLVRFIFLFFCLFPFLFNFSMFSLLYTRTLLLVFFCSYLVTYPRFQFCLILVNFGSISHTSQSGDPFVLVLFKCFHNTFTRCPRFSALFV